MSGLAMFALTPRCQAHPHRHVWQCAECQAASTRCDRVLSYLRVPPTSEADTWSQEQMRNAAKSGDIDAVDVLLGHASYMWGP
jgi:hypothetical protein